MTDHEVLSVLGSACRELTATLADLETAGEFAAAAHVAAAIEVLETRIGRQPVTGADHAPSSAISTIAVRMRDAFGDAAEDVARRQMVAANGATLIAWASIVKHIGG